jgi:hypothetical protein
MGAIFRRVSATRLLFGSAPEIQDAQFAFTPSQGARKIPFVAQEPQVAFKGTRNPEQTGAEK